MLRYKDSLEKGGAEMWVTDANSSSEQADISNFN